MAKILVDSGHADVLEDPHTRNAFMRAVPASRLNAARHFQSASHGDSDAPSSRSGLHKRPDFSATAPDNSAKSQRARRQDNALRTEDHQLLRELPRQPRTTPRFDHTQETTQGGQGTIDHLILDPTARHTPSPSITPFATPHSESVYHTIRYATHLVADKAVRRGTAKEKKAVLSVVTWWYSQNYGCAIPSPRR